MRNVVAGSRDGRKSGFSCYPCKVSVELGIGKYQDDDNVLHLIENVCCFTCAIFYVDLTLSFLHKF